ncbi:hypothetical protein [Oleiagrimonas soli]|uniref:Uncharacterized protein n=1 Tax=Oleiagrimonas soli TaxID=1543381 RepID=A0A099CUM1_9GAMM|nr:hypothetical protein [Oleiagrimonas soli]KGI77327.1 hypothetical protein LF63_0110605 [Oleiagrimonas soli]MBB6182761.1 hypothetical protein [Oleiagrimonas soli]
MKSRLSIAVLIVLTMCLVGGSLVASGAFAHATSGDQPRTVTVFVDATFGMRKNHMARKLTKSEAEYAAKGYRFAQMVAYNENGDLEGFFVTYVRD